MPKMVTIKEAAAMTGVPCYRLRSWCEQNKIVHVHTGTKVLVNADKLAEYLNTGDTN